MIIVNLTTTSTRLQMCSATIWSLLNQELSPDQINLWVSTDKFLSDQGISSTPKFVDQFNRLVNIVNVKFTNNIGPYRKIIPALRIANHDDILIYADDDVIYGKKWLYNLYNEFKNNDEQSVVATRVRMREKNIFGIYKSYPSYKVITDNLTLKTDFILTGVGGVILKRSMISEKYIFNDDFLKIAPTTDDLWISKIIELSHQRINTCPTNLSEVQEIQHQNNSLCSSNTLFNTTYKSFSVIYRIKNKIFSYFGLLKTNNDICIDKIENYFKEL